MTGRNCQSEEKTFVLLQIISSAYCSVPVVCSNVLAATFFIYTQMLFINTMFTSSFLYSIHVAQLLTLFKVHWCMWFLLAEQLWQLYCDFIDGILYVYYGD